LKEVDPVKKIFDPTFGRTGRDLVASFAGPTSGAAHLQ
jgi:hypothetical protein